MGAELNGILQIAIPVKDIDRATAFYRDALQLEFLMSAPNMAFFACGGVRLYLDANKGIVEAGGKFTGLFPRRQYREGAFVIQGTQRDDSSRTPNYCPSARPGHLADVDPRFGRQFAGRDGGAEKMSGQCLPIGREEITDFSPCG